MNKLITWHDEIMESLGDAIARFQDGEFDSSLIMVYDERRDYICICKRDPNEKYFNPFVNDNKGKRFNNYGRMLLMDEKVLYDTTKSLIKTGGGVNIFAFITTATEAANYRIESIFERVRHLAWMNNRYFHLKNLEEETETAVYALTDKMVGDEVEGWECNATDENGNVYRLHFDPEYDFDNDSSVTEYQRC